MAISATFSLMCEVNQTPLASSCAQTSSISSDADSENRGRDGVAQPAVVVPAADQVGAVGQRGLRGVEQVGAQDPVAEHQAGGDVQAPPRRPRRTARPWPPGKCDPNTSALVVPERDQAVEELRGHRAGVGPVGQLGSPRAARSCSSQSSSGMPSPPIDADLREVHVGVDEAGQQQPAVQPGDRLAGVRRPRSAASGPRAADDRRPGPAARRRRRPARAASTDRPVERVIPVLLPIDRRLAYPMVTRSSAATGAGWVRAGSRAAADRHGDHGRVLAGDAGLADRAGDPGDGLRARGPAAASWAWNRVHLALEPISPMLPSGWGKPQGRVAQREVLGVVVRHDQRRGPRRGSCSSTCSPSSVWWMLTSARAVDHVGQPDPVQLLGARVDQQQLDRQPGQDPGQLVADVPQAEQRDDRPDRERLEQQPDGAAAALAAMLVPHVRVELGLARLRRGGPGLDQLPRPGRRRSPPGCRRRRCPRCGPG